MPMKHHGNHSVTVLQVSCSEGSNFDDDTYLYLGQSGSCINMLMMIVRSSIHGNHRCSSMHEWQKPDCEITCVST